MSTILPPSSDSSPLKPIQPPVVIATSANSSAPPATARPKSEVRSCTASDALTYAYLSLKAHHEHRASSSFSTADKTVENLRQALEMLQDSHVKAQSILQGDFLLALLKGANIPLDRWNATVAKVCSLEPKAGRSLLDKAAIKAEACALGLSEEASEQMRTVEKRLLRDHFDFSELSRLAQAVTNMRNRSHITTSSGKCQLPTIRTKSIYDIPADGFDKFTFDPVWFAGTLLAKAHGFLLSMVTKREDRKDEPIIQAARSRTWQAPVASSVKSPIIQKFIKLASQCLIEVNVKPVPDNKGCLLEFEFTTKPHLLSQAQERFRNLTL